MIPWRLLGSAIIPGDGGEMRLYQRGSEYSIRVGSYELMNSRVVASEIALAETTCARIRGRSRPKILIGGLGMGYTTAAVLRGVQAGATIVVAELVPEVVAWNEGPLAALAGNPLSDSRVKVVIADVATVIGSGREAFDAILLDVDNGPAGLTSKQNDRLYSREGLRAAHDALRESGVLAIWSSTADAAFTRRLQQSGFSTEELRVRGRGAAGGPRYHIWLATR